MNRTARISLSGEYRYELRRWWGAEDAPYVLFVMLNPSTADADVDDPTIRRCIGFTKSWGYSRLFVGNLFAYRATRPAELKTARDPVGHPNDVWLRSMARGAKLVIAAWGAHGPAGRAAEVTTILTEWGEVHCLGLTKAGRPRHPLYVRGETQPVPFAQRTRAAA